MTEDTNDPRHIYNARAWRAAKDAELDMMRALEREIDPEPKNTPFGMLRRAFENES